MFARGSTPFLTGGSREFRERILAMLVMSVRLSLRKGALRPPIREQSFANVVQVALSPERNPESPLRLSLMLMLGLRSQL